MLRTIAVALSVLCGALLAGCAAPAPVTGSPATTAPTASVAAATPLFPVVTAPPLVTDPPKPAPAPRIAPNFSPLACSQVQTTVPPTHDYCVP